MTSGHGLATLEEDALGGAARAKIKSEISALRISKAGIFNKEH